MIIKDELDIYPLIENGKYPENLWGKFFKVKSITNWNYIQKDGALIWSVYEEVAEFILDLLEKNVPESPKTSISPKNISIEEITILRKSFNLPDIIELRKEGLI